MSNPVTDRVVDGLGQTFTEHAGPLLPVLLNAYTDPAAHADALLARTPAGSVAAFDLARTPAPRWLGDAFGAKVPPGLSTEEAREFVRARPYWRRGTPAALRAAIAARLTGDRRVTLHERDGSPWRLRAQVYTSEVPAGVTAADLAAAAADQKPVGIVLTIEIVAGASYAHMAEEHGPTYADQAADFATYGSAANHLPEEGTTT